MHITVLSLLINVVILGNINNRRSQTSALEPCPLIRTSYAPGVPHVSSTSPILHSTRQVMQYQKHKYKGTINIKGL